MLLTSIGTGCCLGNAFQSHHGNFAHACIHKLNTGIGAPMDWNISYIAILHNRKKTEWHCWKYPVFCLDCVVFELGPLGQHLRRQMGPHCLQLQSLCVRVCVCVRVCEAIFLDNILDLRFMFDVWLGRAEGACWAPYDTFFRRWSWKKNPKKQTNRETKTDTWRQQFPLLALPHFLSSFIHLLVRLCLLCK